MKKQSPGAERQEWYRQHHPQLNLTLQNAEERQQIWAACWETQQTPHQVLLAWAAQVLAMSPSPRQGVRHSGRREAGATAD